MREPKPYELADRAIAQLNRQAVRRLALTKQALLAGGFDELNVIRRVHELYSALDRDNRRKFKEIFALRYVEMLVYSGGERPTEDEIDELAEAYITGLLSEPNEVSHYAYDAEVLRKRDRAAEAVNAVPGRVQKQIELDKHLKYWAQMTGWYADFTDEDASVQALSDAGVTKVRRHEKNDAKTCKICGEADGEVYPIDKIPPKPHLHCRRWFTRYHQ